MILDDLKTFVLYVDDTNFLSCYDLKTFVQYGDDPNDSWKFNWSWLKNGSALAV